MVHEAQSRSLLSWRWRFWGPRQVLNAGGQHPICACNKDIDSFSGPLCSMLASLQTPPPYLSRSAECEH